MARIELDLESMLLACILVGLLLLAWIVIAWCKRRLAARQAPAPGNGIEDYRALLEQGLLDPLEFERVRHRLEEKGPTDSSPPPAPPAARP